MLNAAAVTNGPTSSSSECPPPTPQCSYERTCGNQATRGCSLANAAALVLKDAKSWSRSEDICDADIEALTSQLEKFDWKEDVIDAARKMLDSEVGSEHKSGVLKFKNMLCVARDQVLRVAQDVVNSGVVPRLVYFVAHSDDSELQLASAFCLTNIAAGDDSETEAVVAGGAIPVLMKLLNCQNPQLRRQGIFCLANIAGSTANSRRLLSCQPSYCRRVILSAVECNDQSIENIAAWNVRNLCVLQGAPFETLKFAISYFCEAFCGPFRNHEIERYAFEAIASVCRYPEGRLEVLKHPFDIISYCCDCIDQDNGNDTKLYAMDIFYEIARGGFHDKDAIFAAAGEFSLTQLLCDRDNTVKIRIRGLEVLNALAKGAPQPHMARLLSSACPGRRNAQALEQAMIRNKSNNTVVSPLFTPANVDSYKVSPVDVCLDICFQRGGPEDPVLRQSAALFVNVVVKHSAVEALSINNRVEEMLPLILDIMEYESSWDENNINSQFNSPDPDEGAMSDSTPPEKNSQSCKVARGAEDPSSNIVAALGAMARLIEVGERIACMRSLENNPVVVVLEQLEASARLRDLLSKTNSVLVSEMVISLLTQQFSFPQVE